MSTQPSRVYLVGAGPGDPGLITRRGLELLRVCDVVLYDRLVPPELLDETPEHAEKVFVGKKPGEVHSRQLVADALMVQRASEGKTVVRLKGGDPFVFGRGGEEAALLIEAGIPCEIVPGVSSAIAVPAYAGIPVTHRGLSGSFAVLTAREEEGKLSTEHLRASAGTDTLVLLMGLSALEAVAAELIDAGRSPQTPAAVIEWGTTAAQRTVVGDLTSIAKTATDSGIKPPAITVVGEVVRLREVMNWYESKPLFGLRVAVTRPQRSSGKLSSRLIELGARVLLVPTIEIADPESWHPLDNAIQELANGTYSWVVFASTNSVESVFARLRHASLDARAFGGTRVAVVGPKTATMLSDRGIAADLVPDNYTGTALASALGPGTDRVLFPRVAGGSSDVIEELAELGWKVDEVPAYRNLPARAEGEAIRAIRAGEFDVVTFTSASTVRNFAELAKPDEVALSPGDEPARRVACIGPETAKEATRLGFRVDIVATDHTIEGLVDSVLAVWTAESRQ